MAICRLGEKVRGAAIALSSAAEAAARSRSNWPEWKSGSSGGLDRRADLRTARELPQRDDKDFYRADLIGCEVVNLAGVGLGACSILWRPRRRP